jgi:vacuolar-type H+-ATPase subunit I/STV1
MKSLLSKLYTKAIWLFAIILSFIGLKSGAAFRTIAKDDRMKAFFDPSAWVLIVVGGILLTLRIPVSPDGPVNLPQFITTITLCGGILLIAGFALVVTRLFWSGTSIKDLKDAVSKGNVAAGIELAGLKIFSGLVIIGFAIWLALSYGAGVNGR